VWKIWTWPRNAAKQEQLQQTAQTNAETTVPTQWKTVEESESEELFLAANTQSGSSSRQVSWAPLPWSEASSSTTNTPPTSGMSSQRPSVISDDSVDPLDCAGGFPKAE
jgi:hypothetical protein